jgi:AraC-like DNA-binding protein
MNFQLTPWSFFLLFGSFQALILATIFALYKRGAKLSNRFMTIFLIVFAIILFDHSLRLSELYKVIPWGLYISDSIWYLIGPLLWFYLKFRIKDQQLSLLDLLHFVPFLGFVIIYGNLPFLDPEIKIRYLENYLQRGEVHSMRVKVFILIMMIQMTAYFIASYIFLNRIEREYKSASSDNRIFDLIILKRIILFFGLYFLFEFSFSTFRNFSNIQNRFIENWSLVMWTLFMISFVITIVRYPDNVFEIIRLGVKRNVNLDLGKFKELLLKYMDSEKPYLKGRLTLPELASGIGCTPNQLSFVLNQGMNTSFYDLINSYRVQHVAKQLEEGLHKKLSIFGVAQASGFRSKASFYSFFKKEFGTTPSRFIKDNNL